MADVFVSYSRKNLDRVSTITDGLQSAGLNLWWDRRLKAGDDFTRVIEAELGQAQSVVVAWSETARNSLWVRAEATEALDAGKLIQIRLDDAKPPLPFTVVEMHDFKRWRGQRDGHPWADLVDGIQAKTGGAKKFLEDPPAGSALQGMGGAAIVGWISILTASATSLATTAFASGQISPALYGNLTIGAFAVSCVTFGMSLARVLETAAASRQT